MPTIATTTAAYRGSKPRHPSQRHRIFLAILKAGKVGMTLDEVMVSLGLNQSAGTRIAELKRIGAVVDTLTTRATRSGAQATVWVVPDDIARRAQAMLDAKLSTP